MISHVPNTVTYIYSRTCNRLGNNWLVLLLSVCTNAHVRVHTQIWTPEAAVQLFETGSFTAQDLTCRLAWQVCKSATCLSPSLFMWILGIQQRFFLMLWRQTLYRELSPKPSSGLLKKSMFQYSSCSPGFPQALGNPPDFIWQALELKAQVTRPITCRYALKLSIQSVQFHSYIYSFSGLEEQYIILIFQTGLDHQAEVVFESIITDIGIRNNVPNFFAKILFDEANSRLVACTRSYEESIKGNCAQKENKVKTVIIF